MMYPVQEFHAGKNIFSLFTFHPQLQPLVRTNTHKNRVKLVFDFFQVDPGVQLKFNTRVHDFLYFRVQYFSRQPVPGNAPQQHTPGLVGSFKNGD